MDANSKKRTQNLLFYTAAVLIIILQLLLCMHQIASYWQWGHNGYNGAAALQAARNSLRWGLLWPAQYHTSHTKPKPEDLYTHAPLALYWLVTLSVALFGETELSVRLVPSLFSVLAAIMLIIFLAKHYSRKMALLGGIIYVMLPINTIYCNMANHSTGFIFFALLMFDGYLEWTKSGRNIWLLETGVGFIGTTFFDWPGFTVAMCLGIAALYEGLRPFQNGCPLGRRELYFSIALILLTLGLFAGFWAWVSMVRGTDDLYAAIYNRSTTSSIIRSIGSLYETVVSYMFPPTVRILAIVWLAVMFILHASRKFRKVDVVPVAFFIAGFVHYLLFPVAAAIHHYWIWPFNPFVAIACAQVILWICAGIAQAERYFTNKQARVAIKVLAFAVPLLAFMASYIPVAYKRFKEVRAVGGSPGITNYTRDYRKIMFARVVNSWTRPHDGVAIHTSISHRIEVEATLDRPWSDVKDKHLDKLPSVLGHERRWVLIGDMKKLNRKLLLPLVQQHPFAQIDSYFFVDLRRQGKKFSAYTFKSLPASIWWKFFVTPYDPPLQLVRLPSQDWQLEKMFEEAEEGAAYLKATQPTHPLSHMTVKPWKFLR